MARWRTQSTGPFFVGTLTPPYTSGGFTQDVYQRTGTNAFDALLDHLLAAQAIEIGLASHGKIPMISSLDSGSQWTPRRNRRDQGCPE
jgi:hypothetical protein